MKRPFLPVALCYGAGLLCAEFLPLPAGFIWTIAALLTLSALGLAKPRVSLLSLALVAAGWANLVLRQAILSPHDLRSLLAERALRSAAAQPSTSSPPRAPKSRSSRRWER